MLVFKNTKLKIMNPRIGPPQYHIGRSAYRAESYLDTTIVIAGIGWCRSESFGHNVRRPTQFVCPNRNTIYT